MMSDFMSAGMKQSNVQIYDMNYSWQHSVRDN